MKNIIYTLTIASLLITSHSTMAEEKVTQKKIENNIAVPTTLGDVFNFNDDEWYLLLLPKHGCLDFKAADAFFPGIKNFKTPKQVIEGMKKDGVKPEIMELGGSIMVFSPDDDIGLIFMTGSDCSKIPLPNLLKQALIDVVKKNKK